MSRGSRTEGRRTGCCEDAVSVIKTYHRTRICNSQDLPCASSFVQVTRSSHSIPILALLVIRQYDGFVPMIAFGLRTKLSDDFVLGIFFFHFSIFEYDCVVTTFKCCFFRL